ncbi:MAG: hypothetical protein AAFZ18_34815 [Myxococcota bacterium]
MMRFRRILWTKNVALEEGELAYGGVDPTVKAREPKRPGDLFELHSTPEDADSLGDPESGDLIVLTQHGQATHLAEIVGGGVEPRSRRTMRRGSRDSRFSYQRTLRLVALHDFEAAPFVEDAFGFDPQNEGGEVFALEDLPAFERSGQPLWAVQRRLEQQLDGPPNVRELFLSRRRGPSLEEQMTRELEAELLGGGPKAAATGTADAAPKRFRTLRSSHRPLPPRK